MQSLCPHGGNTFTCRSIDLYKDVVARGDATCDSPVFETEVKGVAYSVSLILRLADVLREMDSLLVIRVGNMGRVYIYYKQLRGYRSAALSIIANKKDGSLCGELP